MNKIGKTKENSKGAVVKFFLWMAAFAVLGAVSSIVVMKMEDGITEFIGGITNWFITQGVWICGALILANIGVCIYICVNGKKLCEGWKEEDEEGYEKLECRLSNYIGFCSVGMILNFTVFLGLFSVMIKEGGIVDSLVIIVVLFLLFCVSIVISILTQRKLVEFEKYLNPQFKGEVLDRNFHKDWMECCDEQEKISIYRAGYKAYAANSTLYPICLVIMVIFSEFLNIGFFAFFLLGLLWISQTVVYVRESKRIIRGEAI